MKHPIEVHHETSHEVQGFFHRRCLVQSIKPP